MKTLKTTFTMIALAVSSYAATIQVDWLSLSGSGANRSLLTDNAASDGTFTYAVSSGVLFPNHPVKRQLSSSSWLNKPSVVVADSLMSDVDAFVMRIAPVDGTASFSLRADNLQSDGYVVMIGSMVTTFLGRTSGAGISTSGATSVVNYLGGYGYDDGVKIETSGLIWGDGMLIPVEELGESGFGFFEINFSGAGERSILIDIPSAYGSGSGDDILFAIGKIQMIPEPGAMMLSIFGLGFLMIRRRKLD